MSIERSKLADKNILRRAGRHGVFTFRATAK